jgi:hypothetical protein
VEEFHVWLFGAECGLSWCDISRCDVPGICEMGVGWKSVYASVDHGQWYFMSGEQRKYPLAPGWS